MPDYHVTWSIDIYGADSPEDAAREARAAQYPGTSATVFEVEDKEFGGTTVVDLEELDADPYVEALPREVYLYISLPAEHVLVAASSSRSAGDYAKSRGLRQADRYRPNMVLPGYSCWLTDEEFKAAGVHVCLP